MEIIKILMGVVLILIIGIFIMYGTLNPCEMFKKEIAQQTKAKGGDSFLGYALLGGFIDRGIDALSPSQCIVGIYGVKTKGVDEVLNKFLN